LGAELKQPTRKTPSNNLPCDLSVGEPWSPVADDGVADGSDPLLGAHVRHVQVMIAAAYYIDIYRCTACHRGWVGAQTTPHTHTVATSVEPSQEFLTVRLAIEKGKEGLET